MFLSPTNRNIIIASIDETLPEHLKNRLLINKNMQLFEPQIDDKKSIIENNKAFLLFHIKTSQIQTQIQTFDFNELKMDSEVITLKAPKPQNVENDLRIIMEERQQEIEKILSQQKPTIIQKESTSIHEKPKLEIYEKYEGKYEEKPEPKRVSFQEPEEAESSKKIDIILMELNVIKQELNELKKMIVLTKINPNESRNLSQF